MSEETVEQVAQPETATVMETPAEVASGGSGNEFLELIPEELRGHPSISPIKDVGNLARSYVNAQKLIGADKIPMPVNPTDEDLDRIYSRLGTPEAATGYELPVDGNIITEEVASNYADIAHKLRLTPDQAKGVLDYYKSTVEQSGAATMEQEFANPEMFNITLQDGSKLGDNPEFIKAFAKIADFRQSVTSEDTVAEMSQSGIMTPASAQAEVDAIMNDRSHAYWDRKNPVGREQAVKRVADLMSQIHG